MSRSPRLLTTPRLLATTLLLLTFRLTLECRTEAAEPADFATRVQPILAAKCLLCHGTDQQEAGLSLHEREGALRELDSGTVAVVPGQPDRSELMRRITSGDEDVRMPPEGDPLSDEEQTILRQWIEQGARYELHWAYRPLSDARPPDVERESWCRNPIDRFVLRTLEEMDVAPSPRADRYRLIKRLYYDLIGLAPDIEAVDTFVSDPAPDAYERLVDRLLRSEHFGERWGRHWLDKARYADSDGYEKDNPRPNAWRYRDWVIQALNDDMPFDRFTRQQLAGDLLPDATPSSRLATAFNRQTLTNTEGGTDQEQWRVAAVMDRTETLGQVWLGLSVTCARCHSHKYDRITQREYYQLYAYFDNGDETNFALPGTLVERREYERAAARHREVVEQMMRRLETMTDEEERERLRGELEELRKKAPRSPVTRVRVLSRRAESPRVTHVLRRGEFKQPLEEVRAATLSCLTLNDDVDDASSADRLVLADWLVDGRNPLVPRVAVNHVWSHLFGRGIVPTANDFGVRGRPPTHPLLLDWLAGEFVRRGWSRKQLIRLIVTSSTYQQESAHRPELSAVDPTNRWLHRQNRFRVEAEIVRDLCLSASGLLSRKVGGPSVFPRLPDDVAALSYANNFRWKTSQGEDRYRRGMYTFFKRTSPHPNLTTFDCPDSNVTCITRERSNTPLAALVLLNNDTFVETARALARRVLDTEQPSGTSSAGCAPDGSGADTAGSDDERRIRRAFRLCLVRPPTDPEVDELSRLLANARRWYRDRPDDARRLMAIDDVEGESDDLREAAAWATTARVLLNLDEFITRE